MPNFYRLLDIHREASASEIKKAYKKAALKYHPDKNPDATEEANKRFKEISEAFYVLSDDRKRRAYDEKYYKRKLAYQRRTHSSTHYFGGAPASREKSPEPDSFHFSVKKDKAKPFVVKSFTIPQKNAYCQERRSKIEIKDGNVIFIQYENGVLKSKYINGVEQKIN